MESNARYSLTTSLKYVFHKKEDVVGDLGVFKKL